MKNFNIDLLKIFILCSLFITSTLFAQTVNIERAASPPSIDGTISASEYPSVEQSSNFIQLEPFKGNSSSVLTKLYSAFDDKYMYFGIICYDPDPSGIVSFSKLRDVELGNEYHIKIVL